MITYRGVPQDKIADSIEAARGFVLSLECGSIIEDHIFEITTDQINTIRTVKEKDQLIHFMHHMIKPNFLWVVDLFRQHGMYNTKGVGRRIALNLESWEAFEGPDEVRYSEVYEAVLDHLMDYEDPTDEQIENYYLSLPADYLNNFGVVVDLTDTKKRNQLFNDIKKILKHYEKRYEFNHISTGTIGNPKAEPRLKGITFRTTLEGALDVAMALSDETVVDWNGDPMNFNSTPLFKPESPKP